MSDPAEHAGASPRRRGLGMGLSALLGGSAESILTPAAAPGRMLPIELLRASPLQPRRRFSDAELDGLAASIRARGVMQPLLVRPGSDGSDRYEIIAGERRWRAAQRAGLHELPVIVRQLSDREALEVALIENVQRQDLSPLEEAEGYRRLVEEFGHTQEELAGALGKSRSHVANLMRLLGLPEPVRALLQGGQLSAGHARALLGASDPVAMAEIVVDRGLNVRQTEALVRGDGAAPRATPGTPRRADPNAQALERDLSSRLGLKVRLRARGAGGVLTVAYSSLDQLDALVKRLG